MHQMSERMTHITEGNAQQIARVNAMLYSVSQRAIAVRNLVMLKEADLKQQELSSIAEADKSYKQAEKELHELIGRFDASEAEKSLLEAIQRSEKVTLTLMETAIAAGMAEQSQDAIDYLMEKVRPRQARWITVLQTLSGLQMKTSAEYADDARAAYGQARLWMALFVGFALFIGVLLAWMVTRSIVDPINEAVRLARTAAAGDLTGLATVRSRDETGALLEALATMNGNLARVVGSVRDGSESIATGTHQIATGNADLSQRTELQASSLQQTAATMEELRTGVRQNAEASRQASSMAGVASDAVERGGALVQEVVQTMGEITAASRRIAEIIGVIDGIAFQTNILALNAAVEAARAGEQGRGFAVVAAEVRSLAQRSAGAAREIKQLISESVDSVQRGSRLVDSTGEAMTGIVSQMQRVAGLIGEISHATGEQTTGIDQIGDAVNELDRVTQQNAALVEEAAAAAGSVSSQAGRLLESVKVFRLQATA
jgi:methyl-accepting chemotaxis protein